MTRPPNHRACSTCGIPLAAGTLVCPACGRPLVPEPACVAAREAAETLLRELGPSPYFRDGGQLAYTLRGHIRGFLDDPTHPLSRRLLRFLAVIAAEGGPTGMRHLLAWVDATCLRPRSQAVSAAVAYAARRHAQQLELWARGFAPPDEPHSM